MASKLRKTGISVVGDLPWGAHFCYFYETKQDLLDILIPYFKIGLENREFCLWVISNSELLTVAEAKSELRNALPDLDRYLAERSIEVVGHEDWFLSGKTFDPHTVANRFREKLNDALARGYAGMRVNGSPAWLHDAGPQELRKFEAELDKLFPNERTIASCTYPLAKIGAGEIFDVARTHQFAIARRQGEWEVIETPELIQGKQEIRRLNEELEQRVVEQTKELRDTNQQLRREITERKQAEEALDERLRFETLVTELSAAFANLSPNEVDREIDKWLQTLVEFLGVDRASFFQFGEDWTTLYRSHSYTVPGIEPLPPPPIGMKEQFPWITDQLRRGITVKWLPIPDDMPEEALKEKEYAARLGVKSGLNIPVRMGGSVICAITFTSIATYRDWPDAMVARLHLVGEIFAAAVERKRAEAALRNSEEQFRQMAENIREVFWLATADMSRILYVSPAYETVWRQSRESIYREPRSFFAAIHEEDRSRVAAIIKRDREKGFEVEYRVVWPDGSIRWIRDRGFPIGDESGRFYRVAGIAEDITERKDAEEKLKRSEAQLAEAQRLAHIGSWDWDLRTNAVTWSDELYHIFGLQPGTISDAGEVDRFIHPDDLDVGWDTVKRAIASKEPYDYYHRILRPDGTERIARSHGSIMSDERGEPIKVFGATQDVTELKRAEVKLRTTTEQLRALSASVQSAREEESKRIAREIHDELGGALTSWKWDLEEIHDEMSMPQDASQVATVRTKIEGMIKLTETTLDTVRRLASELRPAALELGLLQGLEWQTLQFENRTGIPIQLECAEEKVDLDNGQATAVFRILQEALTNIQRHAQATHVTITCGKDSGLFVLTIKDNGRGIIKSEESIQSLGLLGMRERANLVGGEIDIESAAGEGTKITVRVPMSASQRSGTVDQ